MHRRQFLSLTTCTAGLAGLAGCSQLLIDDGNYMSEGTPFLTLGDVDDDFSGTLRVVPSCRDEAVDIQITNGEPNDSIPYSRQELAEECSFDLYIGGEKQESRTVGSTARCSITIDDDGNIDLLCSTI